MIIVSLFGSDGSVMTPDCTRAYPVIPIITATAMDIITHTVATRREVLRFFASLMAIKRKRTWGIPKYPRPHARSEAIGRIPKGTALFVEAS